MSHQSKNRGIQARREAQLPSRTWSPIDKVDDVDNVCFRIDREIECVHRRENVRDGLKEFGRRALEVAVFEAARARHEQDEVIKASAQWPRLEAICEKLCPLLDDMFRELGPIDRDGQSVPVTKAAELEYSLVQVIIHGATAAATPMGVNQAIEIGSKYAEALWSTRSALSHLTVAAAAKRDRVASERTNTGQRDKREFVRVFVEFWASVTGERPPTGEDSEFLRLLRAAWEDAGQAASWEQGSDIVYESFQSPLREIVKSMGDDEVTKLRDRLPSWR